MKQSKNISAKWRAVVPLALTFALVVVALVAKAADALRTLLNLGRSSDRRTRMQMKKSEIISAVRTLLATAQARNSDQGVHVYESVLAELESSNVEDDDSHALLNHIDALAALRHCLIKIGDWGYMTDKEIVVSDRLKAAIKDLETRADELGD